MADLTSQRLGFWDSRAHLGFAAGSNDVNLKKIEIRALDSVVPRAGLVLDAGCGNGHTLVALAKARKGARFLGFDYSSSMVEEAQNLIRSEGLAERVALRQDNLLALNCDTLELSSFDCVYTQRSLINLDSPNDQLIAIKSLWKLLKPGGSLILCEAFEDGLSEINSFRAAAELDPISRPWHNTYLTLDFLSILSRELRVDNEVIEFSGSYYFVSRVVNAWQALAGKQEPSYENPVNVMSLNLPPIPMCGQSKIAVFVKN